ncbi:hypothetical protein LY76DRAFT_597179 [Colletotrichum caudatum]|nr:hypothetical protein LY76DRAFT_597179 [Colletotrichum caudatum]
MAALLDRPGKGFLSVPRKLTGWILPIQPASFMDTEPCRRRSPLDETRIEDDGEGRLITTKEQVRPAPAHPKHSRMSGIMRHSPHGGGSGSTPTMVRQSSSSELDAALSRIRRGANTACVWERPTALRVSGGPLPSPTPMFDPSSGRVANSKRPRRFENVSCTHAVG